LATCDRHIDAIGLQQARDNMITFFDAIDEIWGIRETLVKYGAIYLSDQWLMIIARLFSDHREFWRDRALFIGKDWIRDMKRINPGDLELIGLARGTTKQHLTLYLHFLDTINSGKSNRLVDRYTLEKAETAAERYRYYGEHRQL
jgi:hypothetical protein